MLNSNPNPISCQPASQQKAPKDCSKGAFVFQINDLRSVLGEVESAVHHVEAQLDKVN